MINSISYVMLRASSVINKVVIDIQMYFQQLKWKQYFQ